MGFYKTYQNIVHTINNIIYLADKFLFHDEDVSKSEFEIKFKLNSYHESHSNNKVSQRRIVEHKDYHECVKSLYDYKNELEKLFKNKEVVLKKLEK